MPDMTDRPADRTPADWLAAFAERIGLPAPTQTEVDTLLELAGVAAHASERIAAPIACWLVGRTDVTPDDALALAKEI
jgi:hypothetical protein